MQKTQSAVRILLFCALGVFVVFLVFGVTSSVSAATIPGQFNKSSPANGGLSNATVTFTWTASTSAEYYELCISDSIDSCPKWVKVGSKLKVTTSFILDQGKTYYWQVRAVKGGSITYADGEMTKWHFDVPFPPGAFTKDAPNDGETTDLAPTLTWTTPTDASSYQVCYALSTAKCTNWTTTVAASKTLNNLKDASTYYWQVRAINPNGMTYADSSTYRTFHTQIPWPGFFMKTAPSQGSEVTTLKPTISWNASANASSYQVCYSLTTDPPCEIWSKAIKTTSTTLKNLLDGETYYWQVRAVNNTGIRYGDMSYADINSFKIVATSPGAFSKSGPITGSDVTASPLLSWTAAAKVKKYEVCYAKTAAACTNWTNVEQATSLQLPALASGTHYWQVRAVNAHGYTYADGKQSNTRTFNYNYTFTAVSTGFSHTCALTSHGGVMCWGDNSFGELGDRSNTNSLYPVDVVDADGKPISGVIAISAAGHPDAGDYTCALTSEHKVMCWGSNSIHQLGNDSANNSNTPVYVNDYETGQQLIGVSAISSGGNHTCVLMNGGNAKCWGSNDNGQAGIGGLPGNPLSTAQEVNIPGGTAFTAISAGRDHTCALGYTVEINDGMFCWGYNGSAELGNGDETLQDKSSPVSVYGLSSGVSTITAGTDHTCAIISGGVKCWGGNSYGQLGFNYSIAYTPVDVTGLTSGISAVSAAERHTCALTTTGEIKCWGNNDYGQLGNNTQTTAYTAIDVKNSNGSPISGISVISAGGYQSCAVTISGVVKCWGLNNFGQLGTGTILDSWVPVDITFP
ncbi:MAG: hypothetical protein WCP19_05415 [Chloroflexota bacterium]